MKKYVRDTWAENNRSAPESVSAILQVGISKETCHELSRCSEFINFQKGTRRNFTDLICRSIMYK